MAFLDTDRGQLVVHIVFDGSPLAGKTTTVQALAASLGASVESPEEVLGRTIFFDWLEYTGGLWNGHRIRCHVLTVPGQASLGSRRFELLRMADCVVFVFDTSASQSSESQSALEELGCVLSTFANPRPRVLLQLNKRDLPNALSRSELDKILPKDYSDIAETTATGSAGIRDVFVRAVRLALWRVEALQEQGDLPRCRPNITESKGLLAALKDSERGVQGALAQTVPVEAAAWSFLRALEAEEDDPGAELREPGLQESAGHPEGTAPLPPSGSVPAGAVWPPARGRTNLQELTKLPCLLSRQVNGDWQVSFGTTWTGLSRADLVFRDFDRGRQRLLELTRKAIDTEGWLSPDRCLVLSPADASSWRLWEVMPRTPTLLQLLSRSRQAAPEIKVAALVQIFRLYHRSAAEWPEGKLDQELSPQVSGLYQTKLVYTGFLAPPRQSSANRHANASPFEELRALALTYLENQGLTLEEAISQLRALEADIPGLAKMAGALARFLPEALDFNSFAAFE